MAVIFHKEAKEFHLFNEEISYILCVLPNGHLGQVYFGQRVNATKSYRPLTEKQKRPLSAYVYEEECFSLQHTLQEYACYGTGDFSYPAFEIVQADGSRLSHFEFVNYRILSGKPTLEGLPHVYVNYQTDATTLEIDLKDEQTGTVLCLSYTIFEHFPVITRHAKFTQTGEQTVALTRALSLCLDLPDMAYDWVHLDGAWGRERHMKCSPLHQGVQSIYSLKGSSSSEHNPFLALKRQSADEHQGEVLGFSLVYSGNFLAQVDVSAYEQTRVLMGIHPQHFEWQLGSNEVFQTPEVVIVYSSQGLNGMSQTYHQLYQKHLMSKFWRDRERPIVLNSWEAMLFQVDEQRMLSLAEQASKIGVELFVIDDGWFGERYNDSAGLGDWVVNRMKFPSGLQHTIRCMKQLGMRFGLWIEPEMVNPKSELYQQHPDWVLHHPKRRQSQSRHQYVLDLAREDVFQNIYQQIRQLLLDNEIDYIKWDMNRYMTEVYSVYYAKHQQGEIFHRYILNVYRLYEALTSEFPHVLFESCASGGARFDAGMLYYAPQTWTSDNTDAIERLKVQYGTSIVYPLNSMSCHVSRVPNQQLGRTTPLRTRANVAFFGVLGYELDLLECTHEELEEMARQISFYKQYRHVFQTGQFTRLISPFTHDCVAWQVVSQDAKHVLVGYYQILAATNRKAKRLTLHHLDPKASYSFDQHIYDGIELMHMGFVVPESYQDFSSQLYVFERVEHE